MIGLQHRAGWKAYPWYGIKQNFHTNVAGDVTTLIVRSSMSHTRIFGVISQSIENVNCTAVVKSERLQHVVPKPRWKNCGYLEPERRGGGRGDLMAA
jgi:hypothetical protein